VAGWPIATGRHGRYIQDIAAEWSELGSKVGEVIAAVLLGVTVLTCRAAEKRLDSERITLRRRA